MDEKKDDTEPESSRSDAAMDTDDADDAERKDIFGQVVDFCCVVKECEERAKVVEEKAAFIEALAEQAAKEAASVEEVVHSLTSTASSLAFMALQACQYQTLTEAFNSNSAFAEKLQLKDFLRITDNTNLLHRVRLASFPKKELDPTSIHSVKESSQQNSLSAFKPLSHKKRLSLSEEYRPALFSNQRGTSDKEKVATGKVSLGKNNRNVVLPVCDNISSIPERFLMRQKELQKFQESFPVGSNPELHKEILASRFDSSGSVAPLWEDRYIGTGSGSVLAAGHEAPSGSGTNTTERWIDKKAKKQFQLKFQKQKLLMASDDNVVIGNDVGAETQKDTGKYTAKKYNQDDSSSSESDLEDTLGSVHWEHDRHPQVARLCHQEDKRSEVETNLNRLSRPHKDVRPISPLLNNQEKEGCLFSDDGSVGSPKQKQFYLPSSAQSSRASSTDRSATSEAVKL